MKKNNVGSFLLLLALTSGLASCGESATSTPASVPPTSESESSVSATPTISENSTSVEQISENDSQIGTYIKLALEKLDLLVKPAIEKMPDADLKASIQSYYESEKTHLNSISDVETAKEAANQVVVDTKAFVVNTLKPLAIEKLNGVINPLIEKITYEDLKSSVQNFYDTEIEKISKVESLENLSTTYAEVLEDTKKFINDETEKVIISLKNKAIEELDPYITALIGKIPYDTVKTDTQKFYETEKGKLQAVTTIEGISPCVEEIKKDLEQYALSETKKIAISKLQEVVDAGLGKIPNPEIQQDLNAFSDEEIKKLNAISALEDVPTTLETVIKETEKHIEDLLARTVKDYLKRLTAVETATAYDYLPTAMQPSYANNVVNSSNISYDFTTTTNVSSINRAGYGEQWQMVVENINQSVSMAKVFNVAQTAMNAAGNAVDIYITNSYATEMNYDISGNGYSGRFEFKNSLMKFDITLTEAVTVPGFGSVKPIIRMEYDLRKDAKGLFISFGDSYKVKYVVSDTEYEMATTYGLTIAGKSASRSSYLSIAKNKSKTTGHIYEYTTIEGSDKIKACADFYVENGLVSVVGNKSSGMTGFDGYINELYSAAEGRLLGYEVREEVTVSGVTGTYNTLWFNLWDITGIDFVRVTDKTDSNKSSKSTVDVYLNNSSKLLSPTYNSKLGVKTSRKYDVEYRSRFYYTYDSENDKYVSNEVQVPMMFIQEGDNYSSFTSDINKDNGITASVSLDSVYLNKILSDYDTLIDVFIANKDAMSSEEIISYLSQYE